MPPSTMVGCASRVPTWCLTFSNGRACRTEHIISKGETQWEGFALYRELLDDGGDSEDGGGLKREHGLLALLNRSAMCPYLPAICI